MRDYSKYPNTSWEYKAMEKSPFDELGILIYFDIPKENSTSPFTFMINGNEELRRLAMDDYRVIDELSKQLDVGYTPQYMNQEQTGFLKPISILEARTFISNFYKK